MTTTTPDKNEFISSSLKERREDLEHRMRIFFSYASNVDKIMLNLMKTSLIEILRNALDERKSEIREEPIVLAVNLMTDVINEFAKTEPRKQVESDVAKPANESTIMPKNFIMGKQIEVITEVPVKPNETSSILLAKKAKQDKLDQRFIQLQEKISKPDFTLQNIYDVLAHLGKNGIESTLDLILKDNKLSSVTIDDNNTIPSVQNKKVRLRQLKVIDLQEDKDPNSKPK